MEVVQVRTKDAGTEAKRRPSTTGGLTSGYQRTNITTSGVSVAKTTGGYMLYTEHYVEIPPDLWVPGRDELAEGYRSMAVENSLLAEECLPIAREVWPGWEE